MVPLDVGEGLEEIPLEHSWGGHEEPVGGVDDGVVLFFGEVPDLGEENFLGVDHPGDLLFEGADDHGVGHAEGEGMVELHLFVDVLEIFISEEDASSGVMVVEGGHIEDVVAMNEQYFLMCLGVGVYFFHIFEFEVKLRHCFQLY